jgi:hypothetical protein
MQIPKVQNIAQSIKDNIFPIFPKSLDMVSQE